MRFIRWFAAFFAPIAAFAALPLGCGAAQEEYTEVRYAQPSPTEPQPEQWSASEAMTEEMRGCVKQHAHELNKYSHQIKFEVSITEEGAVKEISLRRSTLDHGGLESCLARVLKNVSVPVSMLDLRSSGPISGGEVSREARSSVGVVQVAGAAVALGPIVIIAAGVTLGVYILAVATEETIEAVKRTQNLERLCQGLLNECLGSQWLPPGSDFGVKKDCGACFRHCKNEGFWPLDKCPRPN